MASPRSSPRRLLVLLALSALAPTTRAAEAETTGLLFYASGDHGTTADFSAAGTPTPTFDQQVTAIPDGARGGALRCGDLQRLAWLAPGNIQAQRGTLSFFWRSRYAVGPTEFPVFRVGYADHSSWDMVWLRIDYNGHGFDAFVTDSGLARLRVSVEVNPFPKPEEWTHLALSWDETRGIRFYVNGKLAATKEGTAVLDAGLNQFGPHSRIISPHNVQSDYNFVRGGDLDELRIYDHLLADEEVATLAHGDAPKVAPAAPRSLGDDHFRNEWLHRYGWDQAEASPYLADASTAVRKVEIHNAYDLKRWWWKATDGIRETTWPGVYNRSRLPGRLDYFTLPDWDCYSISGRAVTFTLPDEPWNQIEIAGAAWGRMVSVDEKSPSALFTRPKSAEKTVHRLAAPHTGGKIRFENAEPEEPISELVAYNVTAGTAPAGSAQLAYRLGHGNANADGVASLGQFIAGRYPADERAVL
ncbi:MAG TPA: LamG-like jellyroll fold domain-containing protein, partial [Candidatus Didemnitutus sp.]|nr:LamG-like jellyroll fold domain-containing protein [Candidatus Didemnitutus sp.]